MRFWDADIFGAQGSAFQDKPRREVNWHRNTPKGLTSQLLRVKKVLGRWAVGNAKFKLDLSAEAGNDLPFVRPFEPAKVDDPKDRRGPLSLTIGNRFKVGDRNIQITELGLHDADGSPFKGGRVGLWAVADPAVITVIDAGMDPGELAAWMLIASTVLNLDETIVQD